MPTTKASSETGSQVRRTLAAPREKAFRAWTELEILTQWTGRVGDIQERDNRAKGWIGCLNTPAEALQENLEHPERTQARRF